MQTIRLWEVTSKNTLQEIKGDGVSLESHLEDWLESDISMLDPNLLVIGRQVPTAHGGTIDLLCIDSAGVLVVVELKRGKTPRDVAAQALDYASWVKDLNVEEIENIAREYVKFDGSLEDALAARLEARLDAPNASHRAIVVAESLDPATERIVCYLAELGVPINVATVQHFRDESGREMLAQVYLVDPKVAEKKVRSGGRYRKLAEMQVLAERNGIGHLYARLRERLRGVFQPQAYDNCVWYRRRLAVGGRTIFVVWAVPQDEGELPIQAHINRFAALGMDEEQLRDALPGDVKKDTDVRQWSGSSPEERAGAFGFRAVFRTTDEVDKFTAALRETAQHDD